MSIGHMRHPAVGVWVQPPASCPTGDLGFCQPVPESEFVCQYSYTPSSTICRAANGSCDVEERCTGITGACPADAVKPNCPPLCPTTGLPPCVNQTSGQPLKHTMLCLVCVYVCVYVCVLVCVCLCARVMHVRLVEPFWFVLLVDVVVIKMIEVVYNHHLPFYTRIC